MVAATPRPIFVTTINAVPGIEGLNPAKLTTPGRIAAAIL
jgi:hypothetical protein